MVECERVAGGSGCGGGERVAGGRWLCERVVGGRCLWWR